MSDHIRISVEYISKYLTNRFVESFYRLGVVVDIVITIPQMNGVVSGCPVVENSIFMEFSPFIRYPVRVVNRVCLDMYESGMTLSNDTRNYGRMVGPLFRFESAVAVVPQSEERRVRDRHEESVTKRARKLFSHCRLIAEERVERSHHATSRSW